MLEFTTEPKTLDFKIDGELKHLPLSIGLDEYRKMGEAIESDDRLKMLEWFHGFIVDSCGEEAEGFGDAELQAVMGEWYDAREKIGEAGRGEPEA